MRCTVSDPAGLSVAASAYVVPECDRNPNGADDALEIAAGSVRDHDGDGVPDECQADWNGNGVGDFYDVFFGTSADLDGDGQPDECDKADTGKGQLPPAGGPQQPK